MPEETEPASPTSESLFERWQQEQRNWQRLVMDYVDKATTDEAFLTHMGNVMRGSLLAGKSYPGTSSGLPGTTNEPPERSQLDEVVFAVRRLEGQLLELTLAVEQLASQPDPSDATK